MIVTNHYRTNFEEISSKTLFISFLCVFLGWSEALWTGVLYYTKGQNTKRNKSFSPSWGSKAGKRECRKKHNSNETLGAPPGQITWQIDGQVARYVNCRLMRSLCVCIFYSNKQATNKFTAFFLSEIQPPDRSMLMSFFTLVTHLTCIYLL